MNDKTIAIAVSSLVVLLALFAGGDLWYFVSKNSSWFMPEVKAEQIQGKKPVKPMVTPSVGKTMTQEKSAKVLPTGQAIKTQAKPVANPKMNNKSQVSEPDWGPYMRSMQRKIKSNWNPPKGMESKRVVLLYSLNKKGEVIKVSVYNTSGNVDMDNAAIEALKNSAPFGSLPPEFKGDHIDVQFSFDYNVWTKEGKI